MGMKKFAVLALLIGIVFPCRVFSIELGSSVREYNFSLVQNTGLRNEADTTVKEEVTAIINREVQPPMQNIFLNTVLGGLTGALVGAGFGSVSYDKNNVGDSFDSIATSMITGVTVGLVVGLSVGILLSLSEIEFEHKPQTSGKLFGLNGQMPSESMAGIGVVTDHHDSNSNKKSRKPVYTINILHVRY